MKRLCLAAVLVAAAALPAPAVAFHHTGLPSTQCAADAAGSPSNDNGMAKEALLAAGQSLPLAPVGTPGNGQGEGGEFCANAPAE
jgi:hypothetical protein